MFGCCSVAQSCPTLCDPVDCSTPGFSVLHYLWSFLTLQSCLMSIESVMLFNLLILCRPLLLLTSIFPSIRVFSNESVLHFRWLKYCSFSTSPSSEYSELISFRINCFDLLAVQGTLNSLLQDYNLKASILRHSAFFMVQLSHLYITTGKTRASTIWTFVDKVMFLFLIHYLSLLQFSFQGASVF